MGTIAINLSKGQKVDLTKGNPGLVKITVGLGWDQASSGRQIDCDASAIMLSDQGKITKNTNIVYFGNKKSPDGSVTHSGDNLTGKGDGDDEQIQVDLSKVDSSVHRILFVVNIFDCDSRKQDFGMIKNAFIRVVGANNQEHCKFNLSEDYSGKTSLICGEVYRHNGEWKFAALGEATTDISIKRLSSRYI